MLNYWNQFDSDEINSMYCIDNLNDDEEYFEDDEEDKERIQCWKCSDHGCNFCLC